MILDSLSLPLTGECGQQPSDDWSFVHLTRAETLWGPHGYHRYPAKFIPQLVRRIIEEYSSVNDLVGDPFLGSATTGIEALRAQRYFYGSDIHPVALLISRAKCTPIEPRELMHTWKQLESRLTDVPSLPRRALTSEEIASIMSIDIARASPEERFCYWFPSQQRQALSGILDLIVVLAKDETRNFFLCAFSNILRRCSIWLSGSTKPQKDFRKILCNPVEEFRKQVQSMLRRNSMFQEDLAGWATSLAEVKERRNIVQEDVRCLSLPDEALDLLVTSPPYATCYEYSEMHQLTQLWFEKYRIFSEEKATYSYIGSKVLSRRQHDIVFDRHPTGSIIADEALEQLQLLYQENGSQRINREVKALYYYFHDMFAALQQCARVVARQKYAVFIVGDSYRHSVTIPTSSALCEMAEQVGLVLKRRIVRTVPGRVLVSTRDRKTGRFSSRVQSDVCVYPEEDILIFQRCL